MSNVRKERILEILMSVDTITTNELALLLQVSSRTIRKDIKEINVDLSLANAEILLQTSKGAHLHMTNKEKVMQIKELYHEESSLDLNQRIDYIISFLLFAKSYVSVSKLTNNLYVSDSQLILDIKKANKLLERYHLEIISKPKKGIYLVGDEKNKRKYIVDKMAQVLKNESHILLSKYTKKQLSNSIERIFVQNEYVTNEDMFEYLISHLIVSMYRCELGFSFNENESFDENLISEKEYKIANQIVQYVNDEFQCHLSIQETLFITLQLLSKKKIQEEKIENENIQIMISTILDIINKKYAINFGDDEELKKSLYLHLLPLMNRIRYDLNLKNPLVSEIKMNYPLTFDLAGEVALILNQVYKIKLTEDEIAYLSIHFNLALERTKRKDKKYRIVLAISEGTSTSELLSYKIKTHFSEYIEEMIVISPKKLNELNLEKVDLIVSTQDFQFNSIKCIRISHFLNDDDIKNIRKFFQSDINDLDLMNCVSSKLFFTNVKAEDKESVLMEICQNIETVIPGVQNLYQSVLERENLLTTELGNMVAFPHPLNPIESETFMSVTILDKPILWNNCDVQVIFLPAISKNNEKNLNSFYASFVEIVKDETKIAQLLSKRNFETLIKLIKNETN